MDHAVDDDEARRLVESSSRIHLRTFKIVLFSQAWLFVGSLPEIAIRLTYQKRLRLDDAFPILAATSSCAATGIMFNICYFLYSHTAALLLPQLLPYLLTHVTGLLEFQIRISPFLPLTGTTTYAVKGCFLVFMRPIVWHISQVMNWYYWFIIVFTLLAWAFSVSDPFIICPYFGVEAVKCFASTVDAQKTFSLTTLVTVLDLLSDIMVVSLPIIVLRGSMLSRSTKFGLAVFLCLSIFMAICAIVRLAGFRYNGLDDETWEFFWQHAEGAVAVMMASITAFRTLFVRPSSAPRDHTNHSPAENFFRRFLTRF